MDKELKFYDSVSKKDYHLIQPVDGKNGILYKEEDKNKHCYKISVWGEKLKKVVSAL